MSLLALSHVGQGRLKEAEPLALEALEGCRLALDRNHETTDTALAVLSVVYAIQKDLKKLGPVLLESREITLFRYGPNHGLTAAANRSVGMFYLAQNDSGKAEPFLRDSLAWLAKNRPEVLDRFDTEGHLGLCLLGQKKYPESRQLLISAYAGIKARETSFPPAAKALIDKFARAAAQLYRESGPSLDENDFALIRSEPAFRATLLDLGFPADPFARF
jgi:hypothetical protein